MPRPAAHPCHMCHWYRMPMSGDAVVGAHVHSDG